MTLLLSNDDVEQVLAMGDTMAVLEDAYREIARGLAQPGLRSEVAVPGPFQSSAYTLKTFNAVLPKRQVGAIRIDSDIMVWRDVSGSLRRSKVPAAPNSRWIGLVMLFSVETGEPLAIFPDGVAQRMRVGATSGLGVKFLARSDAEGLAIIGSGWQAGAQAMAACAAKTFRRVRVFSPTRENRQLFCEEWSQRLGVPFEPVSSVEEAVSGADVVLSATNALHPVVPPSAMHPGMHFGTIRLADTHPATMVRADVLIRHVGPTKLLYEVLDSVRDTNLLADRAWDRDYFHSRQPDGDLVDLLAGTIPGRTLANQITFFVNNSGTAIQFAAVGWLIWHTARKKGVGHDLPTEWFTQDVHP